MQEFVVPKSMPNTFAIKMIFAPNSLSYARAMTGNRENHHFAGISKEPQNDTRSGLRHPDT